MTQNTVTTIGKKKTSKAICTTKQSPNFQLRVDNIPLSMIKDKLLVSKIREIINTVGQPLINDLSFEILTENGGPTGRIYAAIQAFARGIVAYYGKYYDEQKKMEIKNSLLRYNKYSLATDSRRREPKKFGGPGARARYQKSYR